MQDLLQSLTPHDWAFLVGVVEGSGGRLTDLAGALRDDDSEEARATLSAAFEREVRYLGSADIAYFTRKALGGDPGVPFAEIVRDTAKTLDVRLTPLATEHEMVAELAEVYATRRFADLTAEKQRRMLEGLGVERERAAAFLKRSAGVFAVPALVEAFGFVVVRGLIQTVVFGAIAKLVGERIAAQLLRYVMARVPWWVGWISPAVWTLSITWTALDVQGPARRKTVPVMLYLGLCALREAAGGD